MTSPAPDRATRRDRTGLAMARARALLLSAATAGLGVLVVVYHQMLLALPQPVLAILGLVVLAAGADLGEALLLRGRARFFTVHMIDRDGE